MEHISIRQAVPNDWQIIQYLNNEVFVDNHKYDEFLILEYANLPQGEKYFQTICNNSSHYTLIAEADGTPVGYISGYEKKFDYRTVKVLEIDNMGVTSAYRSKGIGAKLIKELKAWGRSNKYQTMYVTAYSKNQKAIHFYEQQGFAPIDTSLEMKID